MVGLSKALSLPFVVDHFEDPPATFRRFDELWRELGPKNFTDALEDYLWSLI